MTAMATTGTAHAAKETLYSIGEAADILGISIPTIRLYEHLGLIIPLRRITRHRRFSHGDLERIRSLRKMINEEKISVEGIKHLLALIPCWRIKNCPDGVRQSCPAFTDHTAPCWMQTKRTWDCKSAECRICPVYANVPDSLSLKATIAQYTLRSGEHT
jgi:MerR family transcriptional regulator, heat shock protein HspR